MTDARLPRPDLLAAIEVAAENGADWVQVREHQASARELFVLTRAIVAVCRPRGVRVAVNDRLDVALAAMADAVQLGERSLPIAVAREIVGGHAPRKAGGEEGPATSAGRQSLIPREGNVTACAIGVSVHGVDGAVRAAAGGANWVTFGHIFPTLSHRGEPPRGLAELARVVAAVQLPVIAIGGIDLENVGAVLEAGAAGIAVISAILGSPDPGAATAALRRALDRPAAR